MAKFAITNGDSETLVAEKTSKSESFWDNYFTNSYMSDESGLFEEEVSTIEDFFTEK
jgi:hypothetical protein